MKVGFIGVGTMGRPMAGHLIDGGHALYVHDLAPVPQALLEKGAKACASGKEVAKPLGLGFLPLEAAYPAIAAWVKRIEALPGYERTYPPHWR